ncbi:hypothetical protein ACHQM5_021084 [Ranunculus cassubicifolius]
MPFPSRNLSLLNPEPFLHIQMLNLLSVNPHHPSLSSLKWISPSPLPSHSSKSLNPRTSSKIHSKSHLRNVIVAAGRSKKKPGGPSTGRIEGGSDIRKQAKRNARRKSLKLAESLFYRLKNPNRIHADNFTEDELQTIGMGYDRMVRFMEKDDPNLRHPYDWYKYGEFGPYSWRGIVVGDPIRGRFTDERVCLIDDVKTHEEWEEIEQYEMSQDFSTRLNEMDKTRGFRYYWVFVRHPRWRLSELPWEQWTLVSEVVVESGNKRVDKWSMMGRLGNTVRALITQCAAWRRPDILYVKRPVYQCRFEPQNRFFEAMVPLLDPSSEQNFLFEFKRDDGRIETCTYFGGLCKIVKVNPKAFVDDVVKAYEKLDDEKKSKCLEFLLTNHPIELLHPYTKEWKAKLEEMELGCDAPDDDEEDIVDESQVTEWADEEDDDDDEEYDSDEEDEDVVMDVEGGEEELGMVEENEGPEENGKYWEEEFQKALKSSEAMESLVTRSVKASTELYKRQLKEMEEGEKESEEMEKDQNAEVEVMSSDERIRPKLNKDEWDYVGYGRKRKRKVRKNRIPAALFLPAAVRPFTYKNLVKEIVLMRHAIIDGDISAMK